VQLLLSMKRACVAVIDAAHARFFSYTRDEDGRSTLDELQDRVNPGRQAHGMFTDRQSNNAPMNAPRSNTDDHRTDHVAERDARFARDLLGELARIVQAHSFLRVILVATPKMLGRLRGGLEPLRRSGIVIEEIQQDLTRLTSPQVHDHLAALHVLDPRPGAQLRAR
jgi:protein required for attachment to host cells